ncbi:MAG TPA: hypothetical protein V6C81_24035 [Planktothrix sp.]|jgi:hypothetical protein
MLQIAFSPVAHVEETATQRYINAGACNLPAWLAEEYAHDVDYKVRRRIAENSSAPRQILQTLALDEHSEVRIALSENPSAPFSLLALLAADEDTCVRYDMADNPHLPYAIHLILAQDENPYVAARAQAMLRICCLCANSMAA